MIKPQPPIQPTQGPKAFVAHVNEVPESGTRLFSSRYAKATSSMGKNPSSRMAGTWSPTSEIVGPRPEVSVYDGAMQLTPITTAPIKPTRPAMRPFSLCDG